MEGDTPNSDDLLRRFEEAVSGMELDDLRKLTSDVPEEALFDPTTPERPNLRRRPRNDVVTFRVRVDLQGARPPIWRRLDLRSDLTLDAVHQVLQKAFAWWDYHLHRFSLGGWPFDPRSEVFLCPFDVEEGDDDGPPEWEVRLDETIQEPGDVLFYLYDYGDDWELSIRLEEVRPRQEDSPVATCVAGRRAAPPEDCGHLTTAEELAGVLDDPAHFDPAEVNALLDDPSIVLIDAGIPQRLIDMVTRLAHTEVGDLLATRVRALAESPAPLSAEVKAAALRAHLWYLERAQGEGIELTDAGYLKPAVVEAAAQVVPEMREWIGKSNREAQTYPLLTFRQSLQELGLLRKYKGRLKLTRMATELVGDPEALWEFLAGRLAETTGDRFGDETTLLTLAYAATSSDGRVPLEEVADALTQLGWVDADGNPVRTYHVLGVEGSPLELLWNVGDPIFTSLGRIGVSQEAAALAASALRRQTQHE